MAIVRELLGKTPQIGEGTFLAETATVIGDVTMGEQCSIWYNAVIRGDVHFIKMGNKVNVQDNAMLHCTYQKHPLVIGSNVSIGHNAIVHGCTLQDNVLIGMGAIVMDGCVVESGSIVGAGAVVTQGTHIKSGEVWAGSPARKIKDTSPELLDGEVNRIANNYVLYSSWYKGKISFMYPSVHPTLETERLILNKPNYGDTEELVKIMNATPAISENTLSIPFPYKKEDAIFWIEEIAENGFKQESQIIFAIRKQGDARIIGGIGIHTDRGFKKAEVGYWLSKEYWNQGFATEAVKAVIEFGFNDLHLNKIYATHYPYNPASGKVMQKAGMTLEAILSEEIIKNGQFLDIIRYCILKSQWSKHISVR